MDKNYFTPPDGSPPQEVRSIISGLLQSGMPEIPSDIDIVESLEELRQQPWFASLGEDYIDALDGAVQGVVAYWEEPWLYKFGWPRVRAVLERQGCRPPGPAVPPADVRDLLRHLLLVVMREFHPETIESFRWPKWSDHRYLESLKSRQDDPRCAAELEALLARLKKQGLPLSPIDEALQALREHPRYAAGFAARLAADLKEAAVFWGEQALLAQAWPHLEAVLWPVGGAPVAQAAPESGATAAWPLWRRFWVWLAGPY